MNTNIFLKLANELFIILWMILYVELFIHYMLTGSQLSGYMIVLQIAVIILYLKCISPDDSY